MIKGIKFQFEEEELIIPPLSLGALEDLQADLAVFTSDQNDKRSVSTIIEATLRALKRNYPDMTRERVRELIGLEIFQSVFDAIVDVNGLKRKSLEQEQKEPPGE